MGFIDFRFWRPTPMLGKPNKLMSAPFLIILIAMVLAPVVLGLIVGKRAGFTATAVLILLPLAGFFVFGFLASGEAPPEEALPWKIGYGVLFLLSLGSAVALFRKALTRL